MNPNLYQQILGIMLAIGAIIGTIGFVKISYRKAFLNGINESFELKDNQIKTLEKEVGNLRDDVRELRDDGKQLREKLEKLTDENTKLRNIAMLNEVPQPLIDYLERLSNLRSTEIKAVQKEMYEVVKTLKEMSNNTFSVKTLSPELSSKEN